METKLSIIDEQGRNVEVPVSLDMYKEADKNKLTLGQLVNAKYRTNPEKYGTAFAQMMASAGLFLSSDNKYGIKPPTIAELFNGTAGDVMVNLGAVVRPDGSKSDTASGRLLFPAALLEMVENALRPNIETYMGAFMEMVATTVNVNSPKYEQPLVNYQKARDSRSQPISQLDAPAIMALFTVSDVARTLPTFSIGVEISDEAQRSMTIDFVARAIAEQQVFERASRMTDDLVNIAQGDTDSNQSALSSFTAASLDSTIASAGSLTQKAWVKFLRTNWMKRTITHVVCDIDTYLAIQNRSGRPTRNDESTTDERLNTVPQVRLPGINQNVSVFITEGSPLGANTILGLDRNKALRRVVYAGASYNEIERFVMRRSTQMRIDWSERIESMGFAEAFSLMTLTT
jgi:hypothetical protein